MTFQDKLASLTPFCQKVALHKATEAPFTGRFIHPHSQGSYLCRRCGLGLWQIEHQFPSHCGWPSFDDRYPNTIIELPDEDGIRTEILCARCQSHLGHVFLGEGFTPKNQRDCVNSIMLDFTPQAQIHDSREIIVAGGCFWGIEYWFQQLDTVLITECGYTGGHVDYPSYTEVCGGTTGHYEAVRVVYNPSKIELESLYRLFFEIHDPSQTNGQGPDLGQQYQSAIFCYDEEQRQVALKLIQILNNNGFEPATKILPVACFWAAEQKHQQYYQTNGHKPYCHRPQQRF